MSIVSKKAPHILFLIGSFGGGVERSISYLVKKLNTDRMKISVCSCADSQSRQDIDAAFTFPPLIKVVDRAPLKGFDAVVIQTLAMGLSFRNLRESRKNFRDAYRKAYFFLKEFYELSRALAKLASKEKPDLIVTFMLRPPVVALLARYLYGLGVPVFCSHRNNISERVRHLPYPKLYRFWARLLYKKADFHLTVSDGVRQDLIANFKIPPGRILTLFNGVDIEFVCQQGRQPIDSKTISEIIADDSVLKIVNVGELHSKKGQEYLIKAFQLVHQKLPCRLLILGEGKQKDRLQTLCRDLKIEDSVHFLGWQKNPFSIMSRCDVYVSSSIYEGLPNALLEAMALGMPVVSTNCPYGPAEILVDGKYGLLVPVGDHHALADALTKVIQDRSTREDLKKRSIERVQDFKLEKMLQKYQLLFESFCNRSSSRKPFSLPENVRLEMQDRLHHNDSSRPLQNLI